jgi:hypothetical protein
MSTSPQSRTAPEKAPGLGIGNFPARAKNVVQGGPIKGPGTGTSGSVSVLASHGEFMFPADSVLTIGKDVLQAMVDATHTPTGRRCSRLVINPTCVSVRSAYRLPTERAKGKSPLSFG